MSSSNIYTRLALKTIYPHTWPVCVQDAEADGGYRLIGDVCFEEAQVVASAITPVPGGVGPVTVAMVLSNTFQSALRFFGIATDTSDSTFTTDSHLILR